MICRYSQNVHQGTAIFNLIGKSSKPNLENLQLPHNWGMEALEYQKIKVDMYTIKTFSKCKDTKRMDALISYQMYHSDTLKYGFVSKILQHKDHSVSFIIIPVEIAGQQITDSFIGSITPQVIRMQAPK